MIVRRALAILAPAAALAACGLGHTGGTEPVATLEAGTFVGDAGLSVNCPAAIPTPGSACATTVPGLGCEYGSDPDFGCNTLAQCENGKWGTRQGAIGTQCPTVPLSAKCPAAFGSIHAGSACADQGISCAYPQGRCACTIPQSGPPVLDASSAQRWQCEAPATGCPLPRPHEGSVCASEALQCDYGACTMPDGVTLACSRGTWIFAPTACAL